MVTPQAKKHGDAKQSWQEEQLVEMRCSVIAGGFFERQILMMLADDDDRKSTG